MRVLGIDLGSRRIGVAVSDPDEVLATPCTVVERSGDEAADHRRLLELAAEWEVGRLVVGLPLSLDGSMGPAARAAVAEAERLGATTDLPVDTYDERFTTVTADRYLRDLELSGPARRRVIDQAAAAVMLQAWLDGRRPPAPPP